MHAIQYCRYSTPAQEGGQSLERQEGLIKAFCEARGWEIVEKVYDLGQSAWKGHHLSVGNLGDLTRRIEAGLIAPGTVIVAEKFDRFARLPRRDTQDWIRKVTDAGLKIALVDPGKVYDGNTSLLDDIEILLRAELAWQESQQKSERVLSAKQAAWKRAEAKEGQWVMNSRVPGWLAVKPGRDGFDLIDDRVQVVRDIYQWSADGVGAPSIAKRLNDRGDLPWGTWSKNNKGWDTPQIRVILAHPAVEGDYVPGAVAPKRSRGGEIKLQGRIVGYFPRIVDADLVEKGRGGVQARKLVGKRGKGGIANLFAGRIRCRQCLGPCHLGWSTRSTNKYVRCDNAQRGRGCTNKAQFNYTGFEASALDAVLHLAMDDRFFESSDDIARLRIQLADIQKQTVDVQAKKDRWNKLFDEGSDDPDVPVRMRELAEELKKLNAEVTRLSEAITVASGTVSEVEHLRRVHDIRATLTDPDDKLREQARAKVQRALKSVVQVVVCDPADKFRGAPERTMTIIVGRGIYSAKFDNGGNQIGMIDQMQMIEDYADSVPLEEMKRVLASSEKPKTNNELATFLVRRARAGDPEARRLREMVAKRFT